MFQSLGQAGVVALEASERAVEEAADVGVGLVDNVLPARGGRHVQRMTVPALELGAHDRLDLGLAGGTLLSDDVLAALVEHVGAALQEQHAEDVFLELAGVNLAAQDVDGFKEVAFELGKAPLTLMPPTSQMFFPNQIPTDAVPYDSTTGKAVQYRVPLVVAP